MTLEEEIRRRRTFAIISHPDAGKTTLTEKLLLFGGAIQTAGAVKSNKIKKTATSDFMEIERQRGISVATSVMAFDYQGVHINLLDTPGHKDFAEDTYRTLTAVDSVILVVDAANGVEEQTEKLMEVCRMRDTPVMIFINKMDREGKDPFDLMEELVKKLRISVQPLTWPIGSGSRFKGVYNLQRRSLNLFSANKTRIAEDKVAVDSLEDPRLSALLGEEAALKLREDVDLIEVVYEPFRPESYLQGHLAPLFFGSALNNFGVQELLDLFIEIAPPPRPRQTAERLVEPQEPRLTGFVFKIHANLDPRHRDRIAFFRICSGKFERGKFYRHVRLGQDMRFSNPTSFMAQDKSVIDEAWPGDVVGLYDAGNFKIGDTLTEGEILHFQGIPSFSPEIFKELVNLDPLKTKQLEKGIRQLTDEGVAQLFFLQPGQRKIVGAVGELQFEVIQYRLEHEYGARCRFDALPIHKALWITWTEEADWVRFSKAKPGQVALDKDGHLVFLAPSAWMLHMAEQDYPNLKFHRTSEFKLAAQPAG